MNRIAIPPPASYLGHASVQHRPPASAGFVLETREPQNQVAGSEGDHHQYGALCWRMHRGKVEVLLVTSRDTGRWIIPKGWPVKGCSPMKSAVREAWEEAGVEGVATETPVGRYSYAKQRLPDPPIPCSVTVFPLRVSRLAEKFPERKERRRKWFRAEKAARKVAEAELRDILTLIDARPVLLNKSAVDGD